MPRDKSFRLHGATHHLPVHYQPIDDGKGWMRTIHGSVTTPDGIVQVLSRIRVSGGRTERVTHMTAARDGWEHTRRFEGKTFAARYLVTLAVRFARDVARKAGGAR